MVDNRSTIDDEGTAWVDLWSRSYDLQHAKVKACTIIDYRGVNYDDQPTDKLKVDWRRRSLALQIVETKDSNYWVVLTKDRNYFANLDNGGESDYDLIEEAIISDYLLACQLAGYWIAIHND